MGLRRAAGPLTPGSRQRPAGTARPTVITSGSLHTFWLLCTAIRDLGIGSVALSRTAAPGSPVAGVRSKIGASAFLPGAGVKEWAN